MGRRYGFLIVGIVGLTLLSCGLFRKSIPEPILPELPLRAEQIDSFPRLHIPEPAPLVLYVKQAGCGGPCPEWEAHFYEGGVGTLSSFRGTPTMPGAYRTRVSAESIAEWPQIAAELPFFALPDSIPESGGFLPELPTWEIEIRRDSSSHRVVHNHHGPRALRIFEQRLKDWVFSLSWEQI